MDFDNTGMTLVWVLCIGLILHALLTFLRGKSTENWQRCDARILDIGIKDSNVDGWQYSKPFVKYRYQHMGRRYTGSRVKFGDLWATRFSQSQLNVRGVAKGDEVTVYVNPKHPNQSTLYQGYHGNIVWQLIFFAGVLVLVTFF